MNLKWDKVSKVLDLSQAGLVDRKTGRGPFRKRVQVEDGRGVGVDGRGRGQHRDHVHPESGDQHVGDAHGGRVEDDGVGGRGYGEHEGVGAGQGG